MKTTLSIEESARLIELGVDAKLASHKESNFYNGISSEEFKICHLFTLTDILAILPKEITIIAESENLNIVMDDNGALVGYPEFYEKHGCAFTAPELIDALNQLLCWTLERKKNRQVMTDYTNVAIRCPECGSIQAARREHTWPWDTLIHFCTKCGYVITEQEWEEVELENEQR